MIRARSWPSNRPNSAPVVRHDLFLAPSVALIERLADADDRREIETERANLRLTVSSVSQYIERRSEWPMITCDAPASFKHVAADFARVRALFRLGRDVLRGHFDIRAFQSIGDGLDGGVRRRDDDLAMIRVRYQRLERRNRPRRRRLIYTFSNFRQ